ncbi:MAG: DNA polymerase III subunit gamma/tau [Planctomycetes bacterium]|nr:DNA polymerase III subunit gamma/tau [Planctomycetota bacterium]MCB9890736.1 DNA polymerase III subunit gamma/tau [Planctomycetota bacterium]MCB9920041.1 DNA polymerase III subunit gamma/tau [Planctomycetota bacterium]
MNEGKHSYKVLARRFRPTDFDDVVGQPEVLSSLRTSLEQGRLPHALLFAGSRGVGKTTTARIIARAVNCEVSPGPSPCGTCAACKSILEGSASDVVELDAASNNGVEEVRALREQAGYAPIRLRKKVFILDEVHMFSRAAFNALLKILEEPPAHVLFVLATTEAHKIPDTVRSRCQVLPFRRIGAGDIEGRLAAICEREGVQASAEVLAEIAAASMGGLRDAETALERVLPVAQELDLAGYRRLVGRLGPTRAAELVATCLAGDTKAALHYSREAVETGVDERECLGEVLEVLRLVLLLHVDGEDSMLFEATGSWRERLLELVRASSLETIDAMMQLLVLARDRIRHLDDRRILLELTLVRMARLGSVQTLGELLAAAPEVQSEGHVASAVSDTTSKARSVASSTATVQAQQAERAHPAMASPKKEPPTKAPAATVSPKLEVSSPARGRRSGDPWVATVERALTERERLGNLLSAATLDWRSDGELRLEFGALKTIDRALVTSEKSRSWIESALSDAAGRRVTIEVVTEAATKSKKQTGTSDAIRASGDSQQGARRPRGNVDPEELPGLGRKAMELFDVRHVERTDEAADA